MGGKDTARGRAWHASHAVARRMHGWRGSCALHTIEPIERDAHTTQSHAATRRGDNHQQTQPANSACNAHRPSPAREGGQGRVKGGAAKLRGTQRRRKARAGGGRGRAASGGGRCMHGVSRRTNKILVRHALIAPGRRAKGVRTRCSKVEGRAKAKPLAVGGLSGGPCMGRRSEGCGCLHGVVAANQKTLVRHARTAGLSRGFRATGSPEQPDWATPSTSHNVWSML